MDILHELETAAKWSKINSYIYLLWLVGGVIGLLVGLFLLFQEPAVGIVFIAAAGAITAVAWFVRKAFINYHEAAKNAAQSLSENAIEQLCHYQRNIFIFYGGMYVLMLVAGIMGGLAVLVAGAS